MSHFSPFFLSPPWRASGQQTSRKSGTQTAAFMAQPSQDTRSPMRGSITVWVGKGNKKTPVGRRGQNRELPNGESESGEAGSPELNACLDARQQNSPLERPRVTGDYRNCQQGVAFVAAKMKH